MNKKTFYITTPIYYASGSLHIGHVYTTTIAWVIRNYKKMLGYDAIMLTGSDEHGIKIEKKAKQNIQNPQIFVDKITNQFIKLWKDLKIDYDIFTKTTNQNHQEAVRKQFKNFLQQGKIYQDFYKGLYSIQDEEHIMKKQAKKIDNKYYHPISNHELIEVNEKSFFLKISQYQNWLLNYINDHPNFIVPKKILNELKLNFFKQGIKDLSITRNNFDWGIKIDKKSKDIIYVWLDALNSYITSLGYNSFKDEKFKKYWQKGDEIVHILGKEIARFHCIYWPIILKIANLRKPTNIISHGWILTSQGKMSKSKNNIINPYDLIDKYGAESVKYFFSSQINLGEDANFSYENFNDVYHADLVNNFGNLVSRTLTLINKNFIKPLIFNKNESQKHLWFYNKIIKHYHNYHHFFKSYKLAKAIKEAIFLSKETNKFLEIEKPWKIEQKIIIEQVLICALNAIYAISAMLKIVIPEKINLIEKQLNLKISFEKVTNWNKFNSIIIKKNNILFEKIK